MRKAIIVLACIVGLGVVGATITARSRLRAASESPPAPTVREPAVAGLFYDGDQQSLEAAVRAHLARAAEHRLPGSLVALICPHAGYEFCGDVMAHAYKCLEGRRFDTVVIVGPSHGAAFRGAALTDADAWRTPLGMVPIDSETGARLRKASAAFAPSRDAHRNEHSIEVQVPFLQAVLGEFKLLPIVVWDTSEQACAATAEALAKVLTGQNVLLIASSDMSHYPKYADANATDKATLAAIETFEVTKVFAADRELLSKGVPALQCTLCGLAPVAIVIDAAKRLGADRAVALRYANSGDADPTTRGRCVGYCAVALVKSGPQKAAPSAGTDASSQASSAGEAKELSASQQTALLQIARRTLEAYTSRRPAPSAKSDDPALMRPAAVFVTLKEQGMLRGCIGGFEPNAPLAEQVQRMAVQAATADPRFPTVQARELKDIEISIQVLSPIRPVDKPEDIRVGEHGVIVRQGMRQGVYLPDVATEQGWSRDEMLTSLCFVKAGLAPDAWRRDAKLYVFTTQRFSEKGSGRSSETVRR